MTNQQNKDLSLDNNTKITFVNIPAGEFLMGSSEKDLESCSMEYPQHRVAVPQFFMGQTLVTQAQWRTVAALPAVNQTLKANPSWFKDDDRPVEQVSWFDAMEFCARLSVFSGKLIMLPSEAQWEYACRAGTTTAYAFGNALTRNLANFNLHQNQTTPVRTFPANNWGLYDMHGNLWEWCLDDWHSGNEAFASSTRKLLRGGAWSNPPVQCRSAYRSIGHPANAGRRVGFRVCCLP